jgi:hypothetical protein
MFKTNVLPLFPGVLVRSVNILMSCCCLVTCSRYLVLFCGWFTCVVIKVIKLIYVTETINVSHGSTALSCALAPFLVSCSNTQLAGLLGWGISPSQGRYLHVRGWHKHRINTQRHPCLECDSNLRLQRYSWRTQFTSQKARPLWSADDGYSGPYSNANAKTEIKHPSSTAQLRSLIKLHLVCWHSLSKALWELPTWATIDRCPLLCNSLLISFSWQPTVRYYATVL